MDLRENFIYLYDSDSNLDQIRENLDRGMDPNRRVCNGCALLHIAADSPYENIRVVQELINAGADVNLRTHLDLTPLHLALTNRKTSVINALIKAGASVNAKDFVGRTCLHFAVSQLIVFSLQSQIKSQKRSVINKLLEHKHIDCNVVDFNGETPLMIAVKTTQKDAAFQLMFNGANPDICNENSETPLHVAFSLPPSFIELQLLNNGASISSVNKKGATPMEILIEKGLSFRSKSWVMRILKVIALKYSMTSCLKRTLEHIPQFLSFLNKCCDEVDYMRRDFISCNITLHDFLLGCLDENNFKHLLLHIHKPVVERLVKGIYIEYLIELLEMIPEFSLLATLQMTASSKKRVKAKGNLKYIADMFSIWNVIYLISQYLSKIEIFRLIVVLSDVRLSQSKENV